MPLHSGAMKLFRAIATVSGLTLASRVLGFVRDMALSNVLGASMVADAFFVAMKLPNFFRRVTAEGAFSVAFVPIYTGLRTREGDDKALYFANNAFAGMVVVLGIFCALGVAFMPVVVQALAPGFDTSGERFDLAVQFSRVTFPFLLMASVAALMGGVLNAHNRFAPFASTSIILNGSMLLFLVALTPLFHGNAGMAVSWGITFSGLAQIVFLWWCARKDGIHLRPVMPRMNNDIKTLLNKMGPGVVAAGVVQINLFVDVILASMLPTGAISYLYYADRLNQLPLGLVGVAIATALLPMLSSALAKGDEEESRNLYSRSLEFVLVLTVPSAIALLVLAHPIISALFEHGEFTALDARNTAYVLQAYALGLVAFVVSKVYTTAFFARQDTMTPVKISIVSAVLNIVLCLIFMQFMNVTGIALATAIAAWVQVGQLHYKLRSVPGAQMDERLRAHLKPLLFAALVMGALLSTSFFMPFMLNADHKMLQLAGLGGVMAVGGSAYLFMIWRARIITKDDLSNFLQRKAKQQPTELPQ